MDSSAALSRDGTLRELGSVCHCPRCAGTIVPSEATLQCGRCGHAFPLLGRVPCLLPDPAASLSAWNRQLANYLALVERSLGATRQQLSQFALLPSTRGRLERLLEANARNAERVSELLRSAGLAPSPLAQGALASLGSPEPAEARAALEREAFGLVAYFNHILRDWSDDAGAAAENRRALDLVMSAAGETAGRRPGSWGRTLVLGAGACRLAYDVACTGAPSWVVALDISPLLLLAAERIVFGGGLRLFEVPETPRDLAAACVERTLVAGSGAAPPLFLVLGDAFASPFRSGSFDTIVTPWFVDIVPVDLRDTLALVHDLLAPGGRWVHCGPLAYPADRPLMQRYTAEELVDLSNRAGLKVIASRTERVELLRSGANTRTRSEDALVLAANKVEPPREAADGVPPWLLFAHIPIPRFVLEQPPAEPILAYVMGLMDGTRTLRDIAARMVADHGARPDAALDGTRALLTLLYQTYLTKAADVSSALEPELSA
jgi:SAM-dependent methyltransferase